MTTEYFHADSKAADGFRNHCKTCRSEDASANIKPTRRANETEGDYDRRLKVWQIELDIRAAGDVLNEHDSSSPRRTAARRAIKRAVKLRESLTQPKSLDSISLSGIALAPDAAPKVEPFRTPHEAGSPGYVEAFDQWMKVHGVLAAWRLHETDPEAFAKHDAFYGKPKTDDYSSKVPGLTAQERINRVKAYTPDIPDAPVVAMPAQPPLIVLELVCDGFRFTEDGKRILADTNLNGVEILRCGAPTGYESGSGKWPAGTFFDFCTMQWMRRG
jgi:hypothetical protein